jgi:SAM-dependent methyltransferase
MGSDAGGCYDPDWVRTHYAAYGDQEWHRWEANPVERVKYLVHRQILREYVTANDRVFDAGAGAGRFTRELASLSAGVVVGDLSPEQLELNRQHASEYGYSDAIEAWIECDICELEPHFDDNSFDVVVCYGGPLSYVLDERSAALRELVRVARPGGLLLLSVMSLWGSAHQYLAGVLGVEIEANRRILKNGDLIPDAVGDGRQRCHMFRLAEFRSLLLDAGLRVDLVSASDCLSVGWAEYLETLDEESEEWHHLIEMELEACRDPGCASIGSHIIAVACKPG